LSSEKVNFTTQTKGQKALGCYG